MKYLLNIVYGFLLIALSPWLLYRAIIKKKNRRGWWAKLTGRIPIRQSAAPCIWLHAVSVGEVNLLRPLIARLSQELPEYEFAVSTTTETGYDLACKIFEKHTVFFCPFDFSWAIQNVLHRLRPSLLVLAELELWPNLISVTRARGIPVSLVNGRISQGSYENYARFQWFWKPVLRRLSRLGVQNQDYGRRLTSLGVAEKKIQLTGSVKFDGANSDRGSRQITELSQLAGLRPEDTVFLAGSTQAEEDEMAAEVYLRLREQGSQLRLILVPRHVERSIKLKKDLIAKGLTVQLRSDLPSQPGTRVFDQCDVLVVDVIGELSSWWGVADIAFVGGTMGDRGGQNMIEPAAYGVPVCFGPHTWNFQDVVQLLLDRHAAQVICSAAELLEFVQASIEQPQLAHQMGLRGRQLVLQQRGAVERTVSMLNEILLQEPAQEVGSTSKEAAAA